MSYKDKDVQKEVQRLWIAKRRESVLSTKVCSCGAKATTVVPKVSFSYSRIKLEELLKTRTFYCDFHFIHHNKVESSKRATKHGHAGKDSPTYISWRSMRDRCTNPLKDNYKWYGAIGVTICERWTIFENFLADMGERPSGMTLDRSDPHGNYEPSNCRWATALEQGRNKRKKVLTDL